MGQQLSWFIAGSTSACFPLGGGVIFVGSTDSTADPSKDMSRDMSALRFGSMHYPRAAGGERGRGGRFGARVCPGPAPPSVGRSFFGSSRGHLRCNGYGGAACFAWGVP